jgi:hypothetical protein
MAPRRQVSIYNNRQSVIEIAEIRNCRYLYRPQIVVDGNMKLVHMRMKRPEDDVALSDGAMFNVERAPYAAHLASAPDIQPVM